MSATRSWTGDMEAGLHQTRSERCEEVSLQWLEAKGAGAASTNRRRSYWKPPPFEKLIGDLAGAYSRRINIQHRLVYQVLEDEGIIKVLRLWSHYE